MIETDRLIAPAAQSPREDAIDRAIRPRTLEEYVGQKVVREQMAIFLQAARARGEELPTEPLYLRRPDVHGVKSA